jgi:hypothetical protein
MVEFYDKKIGLFFYKTDTNTYSEIGVGKTEVNIEDDYAKTCTGNVLLLLDKNNDILDIDDIPTEESEEICGDGFIGFVRADGIHAFAVGYNMLLADNCFTLNEDGNTIKSLDIYSKDFRLKVPNVYQSVSFHDINENSILLIYTDLPVESNSINETVGIKMARLEILQLVESTM